MAKRSRIPRNRDGSASGDAPRFAVEDVDFHTTTRRRYLNYAMSVITARALPDVRDGLKPVQRRILYTMQNELHLASSAKPLKCARIVGDVLGKFHPHGDVAVYEALVRMAQDFSLRYPLVDGHGNFGSIDGDNPAAYRYTEARLRGIADELLSELPRQTVDFRPNYDGRQREPVVLPARFPNLLVNGAAGIAVGMATNIPPHNLAEISEACEALIKSRSLEVADLLKLVKGPDFPTGGVILNSRSELRKVYEEGQGPIRLRGEYHVEETVRGSSIVVTSIPYMVQKDVLVRSIGDIIVARKVPQLFDVRDESTSDVRIVLEIKKDADADLVMAYLFKNTSLQTNFNVNLTCLLPADDGSGSLSPARADLKTMLVHFIDFRYSVVERRFQHDLRLLRERIHILEGFRKVFDALDEAIRIIRSSDGRDEARQRLIDRFSIDAAQADAVLELRLYKLARLEVKAILEELKEKRRKAVEIEEILASPRRLWGVVREEIAEARAKHSDPRRTRIGARGVVEAEYSEEAFIVDEDAFIVLSRDGWVRRSGRITDLGKVRMRQEDQVLQVVAGSSRSNVVFFSSLGSAYTVRINDIPAVRGYGEPIQRLFKFRDGERVIGALSLDPRILSGYGSSDAAEGAVPDKHLFVVSSGGCVLRTSLFPFAEASTRSGRRFAKLKEHEEVVAVEVVSGDEVAVLASLSGRVTLFPMSEVNFLAGAGRGVLGIKLAGQDRVLGAAVSRSRTEGLHIVTAGGRRIAINPKSYRVSGRGGKGVEVVKRGGLSGVERPPAELPSLGAAAEAGTGRTDAKPGPGDDGE